GDDFSLVKPGMYLSHLADQRGDCMSTGFDHGDVGLIEAAEPEGRNLVRRPSDPDRVRFGLASVIGRVVMLGSILNKQTPSVRHAPSTLFAERQAQRPVPVERGVQAPKTSFAWAVCWIDLFGEEILNAFGRPPCATTLFHTAFPGVQMQ